MNTPNAVPTAHTEISIDQILVGERKRLLNAAKVAELAESIEQLGLLNPITVTSDYRLIAGNHRLEAFKRLGRARIPAIVVHSDNLQTELAEIDENLIRNELTALEQGEHLLRRDEILKALGLRAKVGDNQYQSGREESSPPLTTADIAQAGGISERIAQQRKQIARSLSQEIRDEIRGTPLADKKTDLLKLSQLKADEQKTVIDRIRGDESKDVNGAIEEITREAGLKEFTAMEAKWKIKREAVSAGLRDFPRSDAELELERQACDAWDNAWKAPIASKADAQGIFFLFHAITDLRIVGSDRLKGMNFPNPEEKLRWLQKNTEAQRIEWLKGSIQRAEAYQAKIARLCREREQAERVSQIAEGFAKIFVNLSPRLQTKFYRDAVKRYHPDKLSQVTNPQERQDCEEIARVLLEVKAFFQ